MTDNEPKFEIKIHATRYASEGGKAMSLIGPHIKTIFDSKVASPDSVDEAVELRNMRWLFDYRQYWDSLIDLDHIGHFNENNEWRGESSDEILQRMLADIRSETQVVQEKGIINAVSGMIDKDDKEHIQMFITKEKDAGALEDHAYSCVVIYPPEDLDGKKFRRREFSTLTMGCQTMDLAILMQKLPFLKNRKRDFLKDFTVNAKDYSVGRFRFDDMDDKQLEVAIENHRQHRDVIDNTIQAILTTHDKLTKKSGLHIDVAKALRSVDYAIHYAFAVHKGVPGVVKSDMTPLPPL